MKSLPTEQEYMALHLERMKDGRIFCVCGAGNLRLVSGKIYVCAICNKELFVSENHNNSILKGV